MEWGKFKVQIPFLSFIGKTTNVCVGSAFIYTKCRIFNYERK